jgi:hypothetical protein
MKVGRPFDEATVHEPVFALYVGILLTAEEKITGNPHSG